MISYKYWVFYLLPKYYEKFADSLPIIIDTDTYVYAYTDNKDYADMFESIHNMNYFSRKKFNMSAEQVHDLTLTERNKYMKMQSYATRYPKGVTSVDMVVTLEEKYAVEEMLRSSIMRCSLKMDLENPNIFSDSMLPALKKLRYYNFWEYQEGCVEGSPFDSMTFCVSMDELYMYTKLFGILLKDGDI